MLIYNYIITYKIEYKVLHTFKHYIINVNGLFSIDCSDRNNKY